MTRTFLFIPLLICFLGLACKSSSSVSDTDKIPEDFSLTMQRTGCHGKCPIYELSVSADGTVLYSGEAFVELEGRYIKKINAETLQLLISEIKTADFFSLKEKYDNPMVMDLPACTVSCKMDGKSHQVIGRYDSPEKLKTLQNRIDEIIGENDFQKVTK